ncbi:hypothetical protein NUW58_g9429 [Xylaria curta]|uniref:Uncharacterized protein n=1 Tax=Xylaria curta TaxID=42375 RepID=A0ACC1MX58_9PEZI|nr:hypothetical protein NUW58_g9429 [Xylaria curta]
MIFDIVGPTLGNVPNPCSALRAQGGGGRGWAPAGDDVGCWLPDWDWPCCTVSPSFASLTREPRHPRLERPTIQHHAEDPNRPRASITSTRAAAQKFGVSKSTIARQLVALKTGKTNVTTGPRVGRPSRLSEVEEQMLSFHMFFAWPRSPSTVLQIRDVDEVHSMLRRAKQPVNRNVVQDAADALLSRKNPSGPPVSASWVRRWLQADRAQAREEAASKSNGVAPSADLLEAEADNGDTDGDFDEDVPSEPEFLDPNLDPSMFVPLATQAANVHTLVQS